MNWLEILVIAVINPIRFPVGLFRIWLVEENRKKKIRRILSEREPMEIVGHGTIAALDLIAAIGILLMLLMILAAILGIFRNGFTH